MKGGEQVKKVYNREYSKSLIDKYVELTNKLAAELNGKEIRILMPDGESAVFEVWFNPVDRTDMSADGRVCTDCMFVPGQNMNEVYLDVVTYKNRAPNCWIEDRIFKSRTEALVCVESALMKVMATILMESELEVLELHEQNYKIFDKGDKKIIIVTDISSKVRDLASLVKT